MTITLNKQEMRSILLQRKYGSTAVTQNFIEKTGSLRFFCLPLKTKSIKYDLNTNSTYQ